MGIIELSQLILTNKESLIKIAQSNPIARQRIIKMLKAYKDKRSLYDTLKDNTPTDELLELI